MFFVKKNFWEKKFSGYKICSANKNYEKFVGEKFILVKKRNFVTKKIKEKMWNFFLGEEQNRVGENMLIKVTTVTTFTTVTYITTVTTVNTVTTVITVTTVTVVTTGTTGATGS